MLYECSCGFSASTATAFYKHLAGSERGTGHQLVQAKLNPSPRAADDASTSHTAKALAAHRRYAGLQTSGTGAANKASTGAAMPEQPQSPVAATRPTSARTQAHSLKDLNHSSPASSSGKDQVSDRQVRASGSAQATKLTPVSQARLRTVAYSRQADQPIEVDEVHLDLSSRPGTSAGTHTPSFAAQTGHIAANAGMTLLSVVTLGINPLKLFGFGSDSDGQGVAGTDPSSAAARLLADRARGGHELSAPAAMGVSWQTGAATASVAVADLEAILMWQDPWRSARALGIGLYLGVCFQQLGRGSTLLEPSTAGLAIAFVVLVINTLRTAVRAIRDPRGGAQSGEGAGQGDGGQRQRSEDGALQPSATMRRAIDTERVVYERTHAALSAAAAFAVPMAAAAVALLFRALSGRRVVTSVLVAATLWGGMLLGELRLMSQSTFAALMYVALFTAPAAYVHSRHALDGMVEDLLRFVARVLLRGDRASIAMSGGSVFAVLAWAPMVNIVLRTTLALGVGFGVLVYRSIAASRAVAVAEAQKPAAGQAAEGRADGTVPVIAPEPVGVRVR